MKDKRDDALIEVWNRLAGMWHHHQDGSDFVPRTMAEDLPDNISSPEFKAYLKEEKSDISKLFDIVFNELEDTIAQAVSEDRRHELHK